MRTKLSRSPGPDCGPTPPAAPHEVLRPGPLGVRVLPPAASALALAIAGMDLIGWVLGSEALVRVSRMPDAGIMMPNTAVGILLLAGALGLLAGERRPRRLRWGGRLLAGAALLLGFATLAQYAAGVDLGIDRLLFGDVVGTLAAHLPGRPAPVTAFALALSGLALVLLDVPVRGRWPAQAIALAVACLAVQGLLGYVYADARLFSPERGIGVLSAFTPMAVHTALALLLLALGTFAARPHRGLAELLGGHDAGGYLLRRLLPAAILIPLLLASLGLFGEWQGLLGFGAAVVGMMAMLLFTAAVVWSAAALRRLDEARRSSEGALRAARARLDLALSAGAVGTWVYQAGLDRVMGDHRIAEIFGLRAAEAERGEPLGRWLEAIHEEDRPRVRDAVASAVAARGPYQAEYRVVRPDGALRWVVARGLCDADEATGLPCLRGAIVDVTEQKRVEEALRDSRERFRTAFDDAPIGMALVALDGRFMEVNAALCELVGYGRGELVTRTFQRITHPDDLASDLDQMRRLLDGQIDSYQLEKRYVRKDGRVVWILLTGSVVRGLQREPLYFIAQIQDVSARRRTAEEQGFLAAAGALLASFLDPDETAAVVGRLAVPALADWCVVTLVDERGATRVAGVAAADASTAHALRDRLAADPAAALAFASSLVVPLSARGRLLGAVVLARGEAAGSYDGRHLALAEELARRAALAIDNARLYRASQRATKMRDDVLRIVAHDLRNPLSTISMNASIVAARLSRERADLQQPLDHIRRAVSRATRLIQDLLDVARLEAGCLAIEPRAEAVAPLVAEAVEMQRPIAEARALAIEADVADPVPEIAIDRDRVQQVLANLLDNAVRFTPAGGRVVVRARAAGDAVELSVTDTGRGMAPEEVARMFEPFWQSGEGVRDGAGLGLAIARGIVAAHGGRIEARSRPGEGTSVSFTLPAASAVDRPGGRHEVAMAAMRDSPDRIPAHP